jgi:ElaB/YqjD/DUF883 family membrane-anchored ribosome-binding protein
MSHDNALSGAMESTRDAIADTKDKVSDLGRKASSKFDVGRIAAADKLESAAETLHERVNRFGEIGHDTADRVDATAKEMASDVGDLVKAHPGKALLVAAAVGFLAARALRGNGSND